MIKCPCKDCLVFPMCRNKQTVICKSLISYLRKDSEDSFSHHVEKAVRITEKLYRKSLTCSFTKPFYEAKFEDKYD